MKLGILSVGLALSLTLMSCGGNDDSQKEQQVSEPANGLTLAGEDLSQYSNRYISKAVQAKTAKDCNQKLLDACIAEKPEPFTLKDGSTMNYGPNPIVAVSCVMVGNNLEKWIGGPVVRCLWKKEITPK